MAGQTHNPKDIFMVHGKPIRFYLSPSRIFPKREEYRKKIEDHGGMVVEELSGHIIPLVPRQAPTETLPSHSIGWYAAEYVDACLSHGVRIPLRDWDVQKLRATSTTSPSTTTPIEEESESQLLPQTQADMSQEPSPPRVMSPLMGASSSIRPPGPTGIMTSQGPSMGGTGSPSLQGPLMTTASTTIDLGKDEGTTPGVDLMTSIMPGSPRQQQQQRLPSSHSPMMMTATTSPFIGSHASAIKAGGGGGTTNGTSAMYHHHDEDEPMARDYGMYTPLHHVTSGLGGRGGGYSLTAGGVDTMSSHLGTENLMRRGIGGGEPPTPPLMLSTSLPSSAISSRQGGGGDAGTATAAAAGGGRMRGAFSEEEDRKIVEYISSRPNASIHGNRLYVEMEMKGIVPRSWQSIKNRYLRYILGVKPKPNVKRATMSVTTPMARAHHAAALMAATATSHPSGGRMTATSMGGGPIEANIGDGTPTTVGLFEGRHRAGPLPSRHPMMVAGPMEMAAGITTTASTGGLMEGVGVQGGGGGLLSVGDEQDLSRTDYEALMNPSSSTIAPGTMTALAMKPTSGGAITRVGGGMGTAAVVAGPHGLLAPPSSSPSTGSNLPSGALGTDGSGMTGDFGLLMQRVARFCEENAIAESVFWHYVYAFNGNFSQAIDYLQGKPVAERPWTGEEDRVILSTDREAIRQLRESRGNELVRKRTLFLNQL
jgi:hypothetical protein